MSVIVIAKWRGDPARLEALIRSRPADFEDLAAKARSGGALHHRLAAGDGEVLAIGEWESAEAYDTLYPGYPAILELVREARIEEPPEVSYYRTIFDPGEF
jgi:hypothetical protein